MKKYISERWWNKWKWNLLAIKRNCWDEKIVKEKLKGVKENKKKLDETVIKLNSFFE